MNHGYSSLFKDLTANLFAAIIFFAGALFGLFTGFVGWLAVIGFGIALVLFFLEQNPFVRRACFIVMILQIVALVSWLLFRLILPWKFFAVINWLIDIAIVLYLAFSGLCALNGKNVPLPFADKLIDSVVK